MPKILYGGSVNPQNINDLKQINGLDGFLIGGASQNAKKFIDIVKKTYISFAQDQRKTAINHKSDINYWKEKLQNFNLNNTIPTMFMLPKPTTFLCCVCVGGSGDT